MIATYSIYNIHNGFVGYVTIDISGDPNDVSNCIKAVVQAGYPIEYFYAKCCILT